LLGDARLFHDQVAETLAGDSCKRAVLGRVQDLKARMVALEFELRSLCHSLESPAVLRKPFERVIEQEMVSFQRLTGIRPRVHLSGRFEELSPSQRIALLRIVQEALRNVREHSSARNVTVRVCMRRNGTEATVLDDGVGFDVEAALERAIRDGRVGLVGMIERVRLLGGSCDLRSPAGGPTTLSVLLPRWQAPGEPLPAEDVAAATAAA
jgi:signal transduction histidine kinase